MNAEGKEVQDVAVGNLPPDTVSTTDSTITITESPSLSSGIYKRPAKSTVTDPAFPEEKLFHAWVNDINDPHAAFDITKDGFFVVDYDGDGSMPFLLKKDSLIVYYEEAPERYLIKKLTNDSLVLSTADYEIRYVRWIN
jgi:hypothetical protein